MDRKRCILCYKIYENETRQACGKCGGDLETYTERQQHKSEFVTRMLGTLFLIITALMAIMSVKSGAIPIHIILTLPIGIYFILLPKWRLYPKTSIKLTSYLAIAFISLSIAIPELAIIGVVTGTLSALASLYHYRLSKNPAMIKPLKKPEPGLVWNKIQYRPTGGPYYLAVGIHISLILLFSFLFYYVLEPEAVKQITDSTSYYHYIIATTVMLGPWWFIVYWHYFDLIYFAKTLFRKNNKKSSSS